MNFPELGEAEISILYCIHCSTIADVSPYFVRSTTANKPRHFCPLDHKNRQVGLVLQNGKKVHQDCQLGCQEKYGGCVWMMGAAADEIPQLVSPALADTVQREVSKAWTRRKQLAASRLAFSESQSQWSREEQGNEHEVEEEIEFEVDV